MCKPDMRCALVPKRTCARVTRERTGNENTGYRISRAFCLAFLNICFHWISFTLQADIFRSCSIKNQGLSRTENEIQVLSRP